MYIGLVNVPGLAHLNMTTGGDNNDSDTSISECTTTS